MVRCYYISFNSPSSTRPIVCSSELSLQYNRLTVPMDNLNSGDNEPIKQDSKHMLDRRVVKSFGQKRKVNSENRYLESMYTSSLP